MTIASSILFAILMVESGGNLNVSNGDHGKAYGPYQIHQSYLDDVNRLYKDDEIKSFGHVLAIGEMREAGKASWVVKHYLMYYGNMYYKKTGQLPSKEVLIRMHNGGPQGYNKKSTEIYYKKSVGHLK